MTSSPREGTPRYLKPSRVCHLMACPSSLRSYPLNGMRMRLLSSHKDAEQGSPKTPSAIPASECQLSGHLQSHPETRHPPFMFLQAPLQLQKRLCGTPGSGAEAGTQQRLKTHVCGHTRRPCVSHQPADLWTATFLELCQLPHLVENAHELVNHP